VVSNFWLGQGPWTPWQMAGWGLTGVFGAALCVLTRGRANRLLLAAACGAAGIAYGALLNFSLMASYGGELTLDRFLVLEGRAVPFDAAHAIGNITLALVAGPAMLRMLVRFRERFEWGRSPEKATRPRRLGVAGGAATAIALLAVCLPLLAPARAAAADVDAAARWLAAAQNVDGGFGTSPGSRSSATMTGWAMLGLEATGRNPLDVRRSGANPVGFLSRSKAEITSTGDLARTVLALVGAGVEPRNFAGRNLLRELRRRMRRNGSFEGWPNDTAFSVLALRAGGSAAGLAHSLRWLRRVQNKDGGWGVVAGAPSDADSTGAVLQVVRDGRAAGRGIRFLRRHQRPGGGFALAGSGTINSQSTAWALQGMLAAGVAAASITEGGASAFDYLTAHQAGDGHFRYSRSSDQTPVWVTGQALVAAAGQSFPIAAVPLRPAAASPRGREDPAPSGVVAAGPSERGAVVTAAPALGTGAAPSGGGAAGRARVRAGSERAAPEAEAPPSSSRPAAAAEGDDDGPPVSAPVGIGFGAALVGAGGTWWLRRRRHG
jgi:Prenyltransferase and squalene oxidase repeat